MSDGVDGPTPTSRRAARPGPSGSEPPGVVNATETGTYCSVVGSTGQETEKFGTGGTTPVSTGPTVTVSRPIALPAARSRKPSTTTLGPSAGGPSDGAGEATGMLGGSSGSARSWRNPQPEVRTTTAASSAHALRRPPARTPPPPPSSESEAFHSRTRRRKIITRAWWAYAGVRTTRRRSELPRVASHRHPARRLARGDRRRRRHQGPVLAGRGRRALLRRHRRDRRQQAPVGTPRPPSLTVF